MVQSLPMQGGYCFGIAETDIVVCAVRQLLQQKEDINAIVQKKDALAYIFHGLILL